MKYSAMKCVNKYMLYFIILVSSTSCVTAHLFDDAQVIGKGNQAIETSISRSIYNPITESAGPTQEFYKSRDIGQIRVAYNRGVSESSDFSVGLDFPVGLYAKFKQNFRVKNLHHLHAMKIDVYVPFRYYFFDLKDYPLIGFSPTYIYSYRYNDLLGFSTNFSLMSFQTKTLFFTIPGVSAGFHVGDELKFTSGVSYFNNFGYFGTEKIQYVNVEAGIKFDF